MWLICMIEIMMCSRHVPSSVTWIRQSRYFTSYHSSKQGSNQRSSKRQNTQYCSILNVKTRNCCRSTLTQYGVVLLYLLESVVSRLRKRYTNFGAFPAITRRSPRWLKHTLLPVTKAKNVNETSTKRLNDNKSGKP